MSEPEVSGEQLPRPGHVGDLHEWAKQAEARVAEERKQRRNEIREAIHSLILEPGDTGSEEQKLQIADGLLLELERIAQSRAGYSMTDVFTGEAYNG